VRAQIARVAAIVAVLVVLVEVRDRRAVVLAVADGVAVGIDVGPGIHGVDRHGRVRRWCVVAGWTVDRRLAAEAATGDGEPAREQHE
jgi:hypothetical protein